MSKCKLFIYISHLCKLYIGLPGLCSGVFLFYLIQPLSAFDSHRFVAMAEDEAVSIRFFIVHFNPFIIDCVLTFYVRDSPSGHVPISQYLIIYSDSVL